VYDLQPEDSCSESEHSHLHINIDGLPIHEISSIQLWPILGLLNGHENGNPFTAGSDVGNHKLNDVHEFLALVQSEGFVTCSRSHHM
jgi:hypothetical protein